MPPVLALEFTAAFSYHVAEAIKSENSHCCCRIFSRHRNPSALSTRQIVSCRSNCVHSLTSRYRGSGRGSAICRNVPRREGKLIALFRVGSDISASVEKPT